MNKILMKGNEAVAEAAIQAGLKFYAGYPITPQNEIPEYLSKKLPEAGGVFIQAESEIAAINMIYGASACGVRVMTSSSSPGISLKQEAISYLAGAELPAVIVNMMRGGPGLGNISGSQADYFQAVKGGGHGDYRLLVYAPFSVQEMWDYTILAFEKADEWRNPVMILGDGVIAQMMEPVVQRFPELKTFDKSSWALTGAKGRPSRFIRTLFMGEGELEKRNWKLQEKYQQWKEKEVRYETYFIEDAEVVIVAFGSAARISISAIKRLRREGIKIGLLRPITLFPFPEEPIRQLAQEIEKFIVVEFNAGQMVEDVRLAVNGMAEVYLYGRPGGSIVTAEDIYEAIVRDTVTEKQVGLGLCLRSKIK
ncbi:3-methyl-2-oxobutanoate dehydrogenase subunit VorB [Thermodesulfovibrio sp. 3462-1]|uniref:3-methyl-2-oxobutanoate dehydrogenase subunit VorB n=1 Tax=Thermodesulfovibrio obliviosus TaxID=3118332 RepID=A0AAU8H656_9BACT